MTFILLSLLFVGVVVELVQKYIFKIKEPQIDELWQELEEAVWFKELESNPKTRAWIAMDKQNGLLNDPHYVRKILDSEGHRAGFIKYLTEKTQK